MWKKLMVLFLAFAVTLTGCGRKAAVDFDTKKIAVGVLETRGNIAKSRIVFYDEELNELGDLPIGYAGLGMTWDTPVLDGRKFYVIPQGYDGMKDEKLVMEVNLDSLETKKYEIDQTALTDIGVNEKYVFAGNNINGVSYLSRCDKETGNVKTVSFPDECLSNLICVGKKVYVFAALLGMEELEEVEGKSYLYVYDEELNKEEKIDITEYGVNHFKGIAYQGSIYFSNSEEEDKETKIVGKMDMSTNKLTKIDTKYKNAWDMDEYNGCIYITHHDPHQKQNAEISIYNPQNGEMKYARLNHEAEHMQIRNDKMYILAERKIYAYDIETMDCIKEVSVENMDRNFSYIPGIFVVEEDTK